MTKKVDASSPHISASRNREIGDQIFVLPVEKRGCAFSSCCSCPWRI